MFLYYNSTKSRDLYHLWFLTSAAPFLRLPYLQDRSATSKCLTRLLEFAGNERGNFTLPCKTLAYISMVSLESKGSTPFISSYMSIPNAHQSTGLP